MAFVNRNTIYNEISAGIKIRSRCEWYEFGEKFNNFFLNLEKHFVSQNTVKTIISQNNKLLIFIKLISTY